MIESNAKIKTTKIFRIAYVYLKRNNIIAFVKVWENIFRKLHKLKHIVIWDLVFGLKMWG